MISRDEEFKQLLSKNYYWDKTTKIWWDKDPKARQAKDPNYDGAAKIELHRAPYEDEIMIYNSVDETTVIHDLASSPMTPRLASSYSIHLSETELNLMIDMVWGTGLVVYWPAPPDKPYGSWEAL